MEHKTTDYFGLTKELVERLANEDEIAYIELRQKKLQTMATEAEAKAEAKAAAQAKLAALGLTVEDLTALGL